MPEDRKVEAQKALDQLWKEHLIPFALSVGRITKASDECTIHFHDSRMSTAHVSLSDGQSFTDGFRAAVLERVSRMSGPLANWQPEKRVDTAKISS
jgi:hypothetical protein